MTSARKQRLEELFYAAAELPRDERARYLREQCGTDLSLRQELESLLASHVGLDELLEKGAADALASVVEPAPLIGQQLGIYQITALIGSGGMGDVYRALDTRLGREVALKVLPASFIGDGERLARFEREARILATLNHRNIAVIHGFEQVGETHFLVMELVAGKTLAERLTQDGVPPLNETLDIGLQIAEALEAAHEKRIVHRDLKPANVKVTPEGNVKVLDFGLAKAQDPDSTISKRTPLVSKAETTHVGLILGTPAYMSPEQARGRPLDKRTDIWAFGCVLYELLTGVPPFGGATAHDRIAAVLALEPDWQALPRSTPARLRTMLQRCLRKDPHERLRDIGDARIEIEQLLAEGPASIARRLGQFDIAAFRRRLVWAAVALLAVATFVLGYRTIRQKAPSELTVRSEFVPPAGASFGGVALSPDGRELAFVAQQNGRQQLWVRTLASAAQHPLAGTDGAAHPFWSADSLQIGFFADGKLKKIPASGGTAQVLADAPIGMGGTWSDDGVIVFSPGTNAPLYRVSSAGGPATAISRLDPSEREVSHRWPSFLPGGRQLLYFSLSAQSGANGPGNTGTLVAASLDGATTKRLSVGAYGARYVAGGYILFARGASLLAQRFRPDSLALNAEEVVTLSDDIETGPALDGPPFSVSNSGDVLVYRRRGLGAQQRDLGWFTPDGSLVGTVGSPDRFWSARMSPDGRFVATEIEDPETRANNIWIYDTATSARTRFTFSQTPDTGAVWSPDGQSIVFASRGAAQHFSLFQKPSNGSGGEQPLLEAPGDLFPEDWSSDGRFLMYTRVDLSDKSGASVWVLPLQGDRRPYQLIRSAADDRYPHFSPDGRWIAYRSNESGRNQIYVIPFSNAGGKWMVSSGGGDRPVWRKDGQELYFLSADNDLMSVGIHADGSRFEYTPPMMLFKMNVLAGYGERFAATLDGSRFLALVNREEAPQPLTALIHLSASLK